MATHEIGDVTAEFKIDGLNIEISASGPTKDSVEAFVADHLRKFPTEGFLTRFNQPYQKDDGTWAVSGSRSRMA